MDSSELNARDLSMAPLTLVTKIVHELTSLPKDVDKEKLKEKERDLEILKKVVLEFSNMDDTKNNLYSLIAKIKKQKVELKEQKEELEKYIIGHQVKLGERIYIIPEARIEEVKKELENIDLRLYEYRKVLGICMNSSYFKIK